MISAVRTPQLINGSIWHRAFNVICNSNVDWAGGIYALHLRLEAQSSCHMLLASNERDERAQAALHCHAVRCAVRTTEPYRTSAPRLYRYPPVSFYRYTVSV